MNQEDGHSSDNSHHEEENRPSASGKTITNSQRQQLEEAFEQNHHDDSNTRKVLALRLGLSTRQVQTWFQHRRNRQQQENQPIKGPSTSRANQPNGSSSTVPENPRSNRNVAGEDIVKRADLLRLNLYTGKSKYNNLKQKYLKLRFKYNKVVTDRDTKVREIKTEQLKIERLTEKVNELTAEIAELKLFRGTVTHAFNRDTSDDESSHSSE